MDSLKPRSIFPIVRGLPDHTDSGTYYVRAVIKRTTDDVVLNTVNLIDKGGRYFIYNWEVPADVSGEGFYISIITSVYTDSGHTTKSELYGDEFQTYLVSDRPTTAQILGASGGPDISYKKIEEIVNKVISKEIERIPEPIKPEKVDLSEIRWNLGVIADRLKNLKFPEIEKFDYKRLLSEISQSKDAALNKISGIKIPEFDYSQINSNTDNKLEKVLKDIREALKMIYDFSKEDINEIKSAVISMEKKIGPIKEMKFLVNQMPPQGPDNNKPGTTPNVPWYRKRK